MLRAWLLARALPEVQDVDLDADLDAAYLEARCILMSMRRARRSSADSLPVCCLVTQLCRAACNEQRPAADATVYMQLARARQTLEELALDATVQAAHAVPAVLRSPWMAADLARATADSLARAFQLRRSQAGALLREVIVMERALESHAPPHVVALLLPSRWLALAKVARERALSAENRLRTAIPPCGHRIARSYCAACLRGMNLIQEEERRPLPDAPNPRARRSA